MRRQVVAAAVAIGVMAPHARAGTPPPTIDDVQHLVGHEHRLGDAYRMVTQLLATQPHDVETLRIAGAICLDLRMLPEAAAHLDAALALAPEDAALHRFRADVASAAGDDALADREARAALAIDPDERRARELAGASELIARFAKHDAPAIAPDSPAGVVSRVANALARRAPSTEVAAMVDPSVIGKLPPELADEPAVLPQIIDGVYDATSAQLAQSNLSIAAWEIEPADAQGHVPVELVVDSAWTAASAANVREMYADRTGRKALRTEQLVTLDGLDAADRDAYFARLPGTHDRHLVTLDVEVGRVGDTLLVTDYTIDGKSMRRDLIPRLLGLDVEAKRRLAASAASVPSSTPEKKKSIAYWIGYAAVPVGGLVWFVIWLRRSDERARRERRGRNAASPSRRARSA